MLHKLNRQPSTKNCTQELDSSRKTKSIKSIRIVDHEKQNSSNVQQNLHSNKKTLRQHSLPQQFSFKKQPPNKQMNTKFIDSNQINCLSQKIIAQQSQIKKLERMLSSMRKKIQTQNHQYEQIQKQYEIYEEQIQLNENLKKQILDMKELMKDLLLQKQHKKQDTCR